MKLTSNFLSIFAVFALSMAATSTVWAAQRELTSDGNGGYYINMPATGTDELVIPDNVTSFKVYDDGGAEGGYTPNSDGFLVLTAPEGRLLRLTGRTGAVNSYLYVYDGSDVSNYLFSKTGFKDVGRTLSSGRSLLLEFTTYSTVTDGLYLDVTVVDPSAPHAVVINDIEHGSIFASPIDADAGTTISLTITPEEGYYLDKINVTDEYNNSLSYDDYGNPVNGFTGGKWYSGGVASFTMPRTDAIVRSTFYSIDKYLDLQMPSTGELPVIIHNSVSTFLIRPDYYGTENNTIVLTAPEGKILQIMSEDMTNSGDDSLYVYDGTDENATLLKKSLAREIGRPISTQHVMALHYKGDGKYRSRDAFRVTVLDPSVYNNVTVTNNAGGTVTPSVSSATANTSVTLTATPNEGYMLDYVEAFDAEGLKVDVSNATWYESGEMLFKMPGSAVKVKPVFVRVEDGPSINMLKNGTFSFAIPEGIEKIHIYDDGGKDGNFSSNSKGYLALSAPKGKKLRLGGSVELKSGYNTGHLTVYDGSDDNASELLDRYSINTDIPTKLSAGSNIFVYFYATYGSCQGLDLTITVVDPNAPHAINIVSSDNGGFTNPLATALPGEVVTLKANPDEGYVLNNVIVRDEYSEEEYESNVNVIRGSWYSGNEVSFVMPQTDVTVTPSFANLASGSASVSFPPLAITEIIEDMIIPDGIKSFTVSAGYSYMYEKIDAYVNLTVPEGKTLQVIGGVPGRGSADSLYIYSDVDTLLKAAKGANVERLSSSNTDLTIRYKEGGEPAKYGPGLSLAFLIADPNKDYEVTFWDYSNGDVTSNLTSAKVNTPVTLTATPEPGYYLHHVRIFGEQTGFDVSKTGGTWYSEGNEISFLMPGENVVIEPYFASESQVPGVFVSKYETVRATIPEGYQAFYIYGMNIGAWEAAKPLVLTAPEGYLLRMDNVNDEYYTGFNVYNGDVADPVGSNAELMSRPAFAKTMTIVYVGTGYDASTPVELVKNAQYSISPEKDFVVENGSISVNSESGLAYGGDEVVLTATPAEGYVLSKIELWWNDEYGNRHDIKTSGGTWSNNEIKFDMPLADVYYRTYFVPAYYGDYEINIPATGNIAVNIPAGVSQLNVYDDNGDYGTYSNNTDGSVTLIAPEGYTLFVSGRIKTAEEADSLVIYDGADANATKLSKNYGDDDLNGIYSSGRSLTFHFKSNAEWNDNGLDLYIVVLKKSSFGAVAVYSNGGFTLARIDGNYGGKDTVSIPDAVEVNAIEFVREFTPGLPATVVLPFSLPEGATVNAKFYQLESVEQEGRSWVANMRKIGKNTTPKANTPYVIIPEDSELQFEFSGTATLRTEKIEMTWSSDGNWYFTGAYVYRPWVENDEQLGLAYAFAGSNEDEVATGDFGRMGEGSYVVPMRAYLSKANSSIMLDPSRFGRPQTLSEMSSTELPENIDVKFMDEDDKVMAIGRMNTVTGEFNIERWYDLKGRSTSQKPKTKGAFFNKRVIVK